jgi:hypothetical protein
VVEGGEVATRGSAHGDCLRSACLRRPGNAVGGGQHAAGATAQTGTTWTGRMRIRPSLYCSRVLLIHGSSRAGRAALAVDGVRQQDWLAGATGNNNEAASRGGGATTRP